MADRLERLFQKHYRDYTGLEEENAILRRQLAEMEARRSGRHRETDEENSRLKKLWDCRDQQPQSDQRSAAGHGETPARRHQLDLVTNRINKGTSSGFLEVRALRHGADTSSVGGTGP